MPFFELFAIINRSKIGKYIHIYHFIKWLGFFDDFESMNIFRSISSKFWFPEMNTVVISKWLSRT